MDVVSLLAKICTFLKRELGHKRDEIGRKNIVVDKVIIERSRGVSQRAKFAKKVHNPPLGVSLILN